MSKTPDRPCAGCGKETDNPTEEDSRVWFGPHGEGPFCSYPCRKTLQERPTQEQKLRAQRDDARRAWARQVAQTSSFCNYGYEVALREWGEEEALRLFPRRCEGDDDLVPVTFFGTPQKALPSPATNRWGSLYDPFMKQRDQGVTVGGPETDKVLAKPPARAASHIVCRACGHTEPALLEWRLEVGSETTCPVCEVGRADAISPSGTLSNSREEKHTEDSEFRKTLNFLRDALLRTYHDCWTAYQNHDTAGLAITALRINDALIRLETDKVPQTEEAPATHSAVAELRSELATLRTQVNKLIKSRGSRTDLLRFR